MDILRMAFQTVIGGIFGLAVYLITGPLIIGADLVAAGWPMAIIIGGCAILVGWAPTLRRAFGRSFLAVGTAFMLLPFGAFFLSRAAYNDTVGTAPDAAAMLGAGAAGALVTGLGTVVGLILGSLFLIIGLILSLGGRREVVVVDRVVKG